MIEEEKKRWHDGKHKLFTLNHYFSHIIIFSNSLRLITFLHRCPSIPCHVIFFFLSCLCHPLLQAAPNTRRYRIVFGSFGRSVPTAQKRPVVNDPPLREDVLRKFLNREFGTELNVMIWDESTVSRERERME